MFKPITMKFLSYDHPDAVELCEAQQLEISDVKPRPRGIVASAANIPVFLVAYKGNTPVGCGGLRPLENNQAEIKRMYVVPAERAHRVDGDGIQGRPSDHGKSVALLILEALEQAARERGWVVMKLETSLAMMSARKFYQKYGYVECEPIFGKYEGSGDCVCYEKDLGGR